MTETKDDIKQLEIEAIAFPDQARALRVTSNEIYETAGGLLVQIKGLRKKINRTFKPMKEAAVKAHKAVLEQERLADAPLVEAEDIIKPELARWDMEQERLRRVEEQRLQELARKQEEDRRLAEAVAIEQAGDKKLADQVIAAPVEVAPVIVAKSVPKVQGVSYTERWTYRVIKPDLVPREFMVIDTVKVGQYARAMKSAGKIPGVEIYSERSVSGRG